MRVSAIEAMALVEALIDFGEDEGISEGVFEQGEPLVLPSLILSAPLTSRLFRTQRGKRSSSSIGRSQNTSTTVDEERSCAQGFS